jgi:cytoskeletal protein RodZ
MMSAGQLLQSERLKRNRSLADVSAQTCISTRYLEAIERDDVKQLPGDFFYKAFLRQYAKSLELDHATTDRIVASAVPTEEVDPVPVLSEVYTKPREAVSSRWAPSTSVAIAALVLVLAGGSGLYALWQRIENQREAAAEQAVAQAPSAATASQTAGSVQPQQQQSAVPVDSSPATAQPQTPSQPGAESAVPTPAPAAGPTGSGNIALELVASEPTWVQLSSGGKTVYSGTLQPSEPRQFAVTENARLLTGNAGALEVRMNGRPVGVLGPKGQVRTVVFTNDSFQIAPPKPRPATSGEATSAPTSTASVDFRPTGVDH